MAHGLEILEQVRNKKTVIAVNKNDLPQLFSPEDLRGKIPELRSSLSPRSMVRESKASKKRSAPWS
jgi:signal recognition particle receptor subunit beta